MSKQSVLIVDHDNRLLPQKPLETHARIGCTISSNKTSPLAATTQGLCLHHASDHRGTDNSEKIILGPSWMATGE
ncbi:hypothetical protein PM082_021641 [Marasmius tenuissimus]|nr:hypothetical protein PM082_021641 [Marasmius tenuissimus]